MQRLSVLSNVIPIITKSDTVTASEVVAIKTSILARLQTTSIKPFFFGKPIEDALIAVQGLPIIASSAPSNSLTLSEPTQYPFSTPTFPYAISCTPGQDADTMDASLLMSPDYVQPLIPSELATLIDQVFDPESMAWLRHSAAKKFLAWRSRTKLSGESFILHNLQQQSLKRGSVSSSSIGLAGAAMNGKTCLTDIQLHRLTCVLASATSSIFSAASPSGVLVPRATSPFYLSHSIYNTSGLQSPTFPASSPSLSHTQLDDNITLPPDFSLTRYNNYGQPDSRLQEVRVAKWATDLQRSLRNERDRFEELQRNERAKWLLERVSEEVRDGTITTSPTTGSPRAEWAVIRRSSSSSSSSSGSSSSGKDDARKYAGRGGGGGLLNPRDPLGLCGFGDQLRRRGGVVVKVLGGMSVLGAVVVAVLRFLGVGVDTGVPGVGVWNWLMGRGE